MDSAINRANSTGLFPHVANDLAISASLMYLFIVVARFRVCLIHNDSISHEIHNVNTLRKTRVKSTQLAAGEAMRGHGSCGEGAGVDNQAAKTRRKVRGIAVLRLSAML